MGGRLEIFGVVSAASPCFAVVSRVPVAGANVCRISRARRARVERALGVPDASTFFGSLSVMRAMALRGVEGETSILRVLAAMAAIDW